MKKLVLLIVAGLGINAAIASEIIQTGRLAAQPKIVQAAKNENTGRWVALFNPDGRSRDKFFYDPSLVQRKGAQTIVTTLTSFSSPQRDSAGKVHLSSVFQLVLLCANGKYGVTHLQEFTETMTKGREVSNWKLDGEMLIPIRDSYLAQSVAKKLCPVSEPLSLRSALADKKALTCRYNESENVCSDVDGQSDWNGSPLEFVKKAGYATILKQETFDDPGTAATYLKLSVEN